MIMNRKEIKSSAKEVLKGNWLTLMFAATIVMLLSGMVELLLGSGTLNLLALVFVVYPISVGLSSMFLGLWREDELSMSDLGYAFKNDYLKYCVHYIIKVVKLTLWLLLFIVPGFIKGIEYSFTEKIMIDNPSLSSKEAFAKSRELTDGNKMDLFILSLSFVLWSFLAGFLALFTFGISLAVLSVYIETCTTKAYLLIKEDKEKQGYQE